MGFHKVYLFIVRLIKLLPMLCLHTSLLNLYFLVLPTPFFLICCILVLTPIK